MESTVYFLILIFLAWLYLIAQEWDLLLPKSGTPHRRNCMPARNASETLRPPNLVHPKTQSLGPDKQKKPLHPASLCGMIHPGQFFQYEEVPVIELRQIINPLVVPHQGQYTPKASSSLLRPLQSASTLQNPDMKLQTRKL